MPRAVVWDLAGVSVSWCRMGFYRLVSSTSVHHVHNALNTACFCLNLQEFIVKTSVFMMFPSPVADIWIFRKLGTRKMCDLHALCPIVRSFSSRICSTGSPFRASLCRVPGLTAVSQNCFTECYFLCLFWFLAASCWTSKSSKESAIALLNIVPWVKNKRILASMVMTASFCLNRLTRINTAVKRRRRKRKKKVKMEKKMTSLVQSLKAVRRKRESRRRTNRMSTDSSSWNGMTLPSVTDSSCSLCLYVPALEDSTVTHSIGTKDSWCLKQKNSFWPVDWAPTQPVFVFCQLVPDV